MTCLPQIITYAVVGKETGHRGGQRHDAHYVVATLGKKAYLRMK